MKKNWSAEGIDTLSVSSDNILRDYGFLTAKFPELADTDQSLALNIIPRC